MRHPWPAPSPDLRALGRWDRACGVCGWRFFTVGALRNHEATCRPPAPDAGVKRQTAGRLQAAVNNTFSRRCDGCSLLSTPAGLGKHQKHTAGREPWRERADRRAAALRGQGLPLAGR